MGKKVFGVESSVLPTAIVGQVVESVDKTYEAGSEKKLSGNPCTTTVDQRFTSPDHYTMNITFEFESVTEPADLLQAVATGTVTSEDSQTVTLTGLVTKWVTKGEKENWWQATITIEADKGQTYTP